MSQALALIVDFQTMFESVGSLGIAAHRKQWLCHQGAVRREASLHVVEIGGGQG